jgi:Zn-dependent peptidase ImmA (M78 family)
MLGEDCAGNPKWTKRAIDALDRTGTMRVDYLSPAAIEGAAECLLAMYGRAHQPVLEPPVPIEEILMSLGLACDFDDLESLFGVDAYGALCIDSKTIFINQALDPVDHPECEGRYRFTIVHEGGHWQLHRKNLSSPTDSACIATRQVPNIICRSRDNRQPIEIQADMYAAAILMPKQLIYWEWKKGANGLEFISLDSLEKYRNGILRRDGRVLVTEREKDSAVLDWAGAPLAERFKVSRTAMRLRLERLGLLRRKHPLPMAS